MFTCSSDHPADSSGRSTANRRGRTGPRASALIHLGAARPTRSARLQREHRSIRPTSHDTMHRTRDRTSYWADRRARRTGLRSPLARRLGAAAAPTSLSGGASDAGPRSAHFRRCSWSLGGAGRGAAGGAAEAARLTAARGRRAVRSRRRVPDERYVRRECCDLSALTLHSGALPSPQSVRHDTNTDLLVNVMTRCTPLDADVLGR